MEQLCGKCPGTSLCAALMLCLPGSAYADPPLSALQSVEVVTKEGSVSGYAVWTTDKLYWLNVRKSERTRSGEYVDDPPSPEEVRAFLLEDDLVVYADVGHAKDVAVAPRPPRVIAKADVVDLILKPSRLNGFRWLGPVVVSRRKPRR